ncbi:hypothetical protein RhiirA5_361421 [Rhizophagus irregularis]|uniref:Uncharacterized protein n=1 Tax=Rhizophagus irregularis TaxID=588596 RepID=A0A2I1F3C6_9GLOM|nr:hypothetical protein RhiirA5_361421 [Rhizophagus irregularis]PKC61325.1 hypothetical protein RhiirA1_424973 [Rhizophagus irregularis]PKY28875.1 hypothetical protein RhiirB3_417471 [Rhizophagus irregularis]GET66023.1 hypothetical protein RIR_e57965_A0A2I1G467_9GLOM [Rhizophagus irregularis DAOM 181602=DAOM 197198]
MNYFPFKNLYSKQKHSLLLVSLGSFAFLLLYTFLLLYVLAIWATYPPYNEI